MRAYTVVRRSLEIINAKNIPFDIVSNDYVLSLAIPHSEIGTLFSLLTKQFV